MRGLQVTGLNPANIIRNEPHYIELRSQIEAVVRNDFTEARQYAQTFMEYYKIYSFGKEWDGELYAKTKRSIKNYKADLAQQREWRNELDRMKISNAVGVLQIDSKGLRNSLQPVTQRALEVIRLQLMAAAREETAIALAELKLRLSSLSGLPSGLREYVVYAREYSSQARFAPVPAFCFRRTGVAQPPGPGLPPNPPCAVTQPPRFRLACSLLPCLALARRSRDQAAGSRRNEPAELEA